MLYWRVPKRTSPPAHRSGATPKTARYRTGARAVLPLVPAVGSVLALGALAAACSDRVLSPRVVAEEPEDTVILIDADGGVEREPLDTDPHALLGIDPAHGPFSGGQLAVVRGNGFSSQVRVWFADEELSEGEVTAVDPGRIQVRVPAGQPGAVDISVQNGDDEATFRTLPEAYKYDAFAVDPSTGSVVGGTLVTLVGSGIGWTSETEVLIDLAPCEVVEIRDNGGGIQELDCRTPEGSPGAKVVTTRTGAESPVSVTGAFTYDESATDFEGGSSGAQLDEFLEVTVLDDFLGERLPGVSVILGDGSREDRVALTDDSGVASFAGDLGPTQTVTVAGPCVQPITVVDLPSEALTLYVTPILTPDCVPPSLDIPRFGGSAGAAPLNYFKGELSWGTGIEFKRASWRNVPRPSDESEEQVAYVFELASNSRVQFSLPSRFDVVTPSAPGALGYEFDLDTRNTGNLTLYALAGIERQVGSDRVFTPYVMGVVQGVDPTNEDLRPIIPMDIMLDHQLSVEVTQPLSQSRGPDRVELDVLLRVGRTGFIPLPHTTRSLLLPIAEAVEFQGVPPLVGGLRDAEYVVVATAVTGLDESLPVADMEALATRSTDSAVVMDRFIEVPRLKAPAPAAQWDARSLELDGSIAGDFDLWALEMLARGGALEWRIVAPRQTTRIELPDVSAVGATALEGPVSIQVHAARLRDFDYGSLRQRAYGVGGWSAYSADVISVVVP